MILNVITFFKNCGKITSKRKYFVIRELKQMGNRCPMENIEFQLVNPLHNFKFGGIFSFFENSVGNLFPEKLDSEQVLGFLLSSL